MTLVSIERSKSNLLERARDVSVALDPFFLSDEETPFEKAILYLLQHQNEDGSWGSSDYVPWITVNTGYMLQLLSDFGFHEKSAWVVSRRNSTSTYVGGVGKAIDYIIKSQQSTGQWGEDFYDTCQIVKSLLRFREKNEHIRDPFAKGLAYIRSQIKSDFSKERQREWFGPGFLAAAIEIFAILREVNFTDELLERLYSLQDESGCFCKRDASTRVASVDLCIWHTSWAVLTMHKLGIPSDAKRLAIAVQWLIENRDSDGSWGIALERQRPVFTSYGVMALAAIQGKDSKPVTEGCDWLIRHQDDDGHVGELESTIHSALAFSKVYPRLLTANIPVRILLDAQQLLKIQSREISALEHQSAEMQGAREKLAIQENLVVDLSQRVKELTSEVSSWHQRWDDHPIKISNRFLVVSSSMVTIISCLFAILAPSLLLHIFYRVLEMIITYVKTGTS